MNTKPTQTARIGTRVTAKALIAVAVLAAALAALPAQAADEGFGAFPDLTSDIVSQGQAAAERLKAEARDGCQWQEKARVAASRPMADYAAAARMLASDGRCECNLN